MEKGDYVIVRSSPSGVHAGYLSHVDGNTYTLTDCRRLWRWVAAQGVSLSGVAAAGLADDKRNRISAAVAEAIIHDVCECLLCSDTAKVSIEQAKVKRD